MAIVKGKKLVQKKVEHIVAEAIKQGELKTVAIDSVKLWDKNPRKNDKAVPKLQKILKAHGQVSPIVVNTADGMIYKGNTTWKAMKANKEQKVLALFVKFPSQASATAYGIADNKAGEFSEWDDSILAAIMHSEDITSLGDEKEIKMLTGLDDKQYKSLMLSTDLPDDLPDVDIQGLVAGKSDFVVIQFTSAQAVKEFKERLSLPEKYSRVIPYEILTEKMAFRTEAAPTSAPASKKKLVIKKR